MVKFSLSLSLSLYIYIYIYIYSPLKRDIYEEKLITGNRQTSLIASIYSKNTKKYWNQWDKVREDKLFTVMRSLRMVRFEVAVVDIA